MRKLLKDHEYLKKVLSEGAIKASEIAIENLEEIKKLMGLI